MIRSRLMGDFPFHFLICLIGLGAASLSFGEHDLPKHPSANSFAIARACSPAPAMMSRIKLIQADIALTDSQMAVTDLQNDQALANYHAKLATMLIEKNAISPKDNVNAQTAAQLAGLKTQLAMLQTRRLATEKNIAQHEMTCEIGGKNDQRALIPLYRQLWQAKAQEAELKVSIAQAKLSRERSLYDGFFDLKHLPQPLRIDKLDTKFALQAAHDELMQAQENQTMTDNLETDLVRPQTLGLSAPAAMTPRPMAMLAARPMAMMAARPPMVGASAPEERRPPMVGATESHEQPAAVAAPEIGAPEAEAAPVPEPTEDQLAATHPSVPAGSEPGLQKLEDGPGNWLKVKLAENDLDQAKKMARLVREKCDKADREFGEQNNSYRQY